MEDITIRFFERSPDTGVVKAPIMIEGLPGIGHVGKLVVEHMIRELGATKVAEIESIFFPPQVIIDEQGTVRLANNELYYYSNGQHKLLFLVGDYQATSGEGHYLLTDAYLDIAEECGVSRIYTLGGYGVGRLVEEPRVLGAVNRPDLRALAESAGAVVSREEPGGGIIGAAGLLLGMGMARGIEGICLMGETSGYVVDPKSAASLLRVVNVMLDLSIDPSQLEQRAEEMEYMLQKLIDGDKVSRDEELRYFV